jgi:hypothetical protein
MQNLLVAVLLIPSGLKIIPEQFYRFRADA